MFKLRLKGLLLICFFLVNESFAQNTLEANRPVIKWEASTHDFGDIYQGDKVNHTFHFMNVGNSPLIITNVEVTCGCTVPKGWPRDPIQPGDKGELEILFNSAGKLAKQIKVVTVVSNATPVTSQVTFTATILEKKPK